MKKGQQTESVIKNILKFLKMNENTISTLMGGLVVILIAGMIFNYFKATNLKTWQGLLLDQDKTATTSIVEEQKEDLNKSTYIVKKGDDLWHISEYFYKSGYNYVEIMKANNIGADGIIYEGMELKIPEVKAKAVTAVEEKKIDDGRVSTTTEIKIGDNTTINEGEYITKKGDSYWSIALRSYGDGYSWTKIYEANKNTFKNPNVIHANVKIVIPSLK